MGTRCLTTVWDNESQPEQAIITMYRQFDGYPACHGKALADFLKSGKITNGIPWGSKEHWFNGVSDIAAQIVAHFKKDGEAGGFYLHIPGSTGLGEEYHYHVRVKGDNILITVYDVHDKRCIFDGPPTEFTGDEE